MEDICIRHAARSISIWSGRRRIRDRLVLASTALANSVALLLPVLLHCKVGMNDQDSPALVDLPQRRCSRRR
jgi:hypothetical protein